MTAYKRGDVVLYETASGRRRLGLIERVKDYDIPPQATLRPWVAGRLEWGGRTKTPLSAIIRKARRPVREEIAAMQATPRMELGGQ